MKILFTTFTFPPDENGVSNVVYEHAKGLASNGYDVMVVTALRLDRDSIKFRQKGIEIIEFDISGWRKYKGEIGKYQTFIKGINVDFLVLHCWQTWSTDLALPLLHKKECKKVFVSHGFSGNLLYSPRSLASWFAWRPYIWRMPRYLKSFDHLIFLSSSIDKNRFYDFYLVNKLGLNNYSIIPNGAQNIQNEACKIDLKAEYNIKTKFLVINVSNYSTLKNQKMAVEAFIKSEVQDCCLALIGNKKNDYSNKIETLIRKKNMKDRIFLLDGLKKEEIVAAYKAADIFLHPSKTEVQPLVILDAMAAGIPFISTNVGCVKNFPGGYIANNKDEMAFFLQQLINNDKQRKELGIAGRTAYLKNYSWRHIIGKHEQLFDNLKYL